ncbi:MAG: hypothetical protein QOC61_897 [Acidobacteriota bacterium]|jgi:hypothetical protein|nr:hypothetical protein [Acidobacteriota bacterium]MDT5261893.1 hypothetical protein [Acidobacteriota bacterium]MDT7777531.1 hypothetical protein [Acidobacteriota bacterium]
MSDSSEAKRLWRTAGIIAGVGLLIIIPLSWLALRLYDDMIQQRVIAVNEAAARTSLDNIQAAEQLYYETNGQYATFRQLIESGVFQAELNGDPPVAHGYAFTLKVQPKSDTQSAAYSVNADPVISGARDATGHRHFFISSDVTGVRFNEERPATKEDKPLQSTRE